MILGLVLAAEQRLAAVRAARSACENDLLGRANVVAVATGLRRVGDQDTDEPSVTVFVARKLPASKLLPADVLPRSVPSPAGSVPVDVQVMNPPCASGIRLARAAGVTGLAGALCHRMRPALGGVSVGHVQFRFGTLTTVVVDASRRGVFALLSNNHVLALSNAARPGDPIVQPGAADGGQCPRDVIARLDRFVPIRFGAGVSNRVDAAIACVGFGDVEGRIYGIGCPAGVRERTGVHLGDEVQKVGRTTGFTRGRIVGIDATVDVHYDRGRVARFRDQLIATLGCADGDSGSLVLDLDGRAVGLISGISGSHSVANYIETVQAELGIVVARKRV